MTHGTLSDEYLRGILAPGRVLAVVGASANPARPSYEVMSYLDRKGYRIVPVNPGLAGSELLGQKVYASLADVPGPVHIVDIFRNSEAALEVVREAIGEKDRLGLKAVWMQLGVINVDAAREAEAAGLAIVMNRCPKIEITRLFPAT